MQWYGDNSELNGIWDAELPDILIFGGIAIRKPDIPLLKRAISRVKKKYSQRTHFPVKYNMKDLRKWFEQRGEEELFRKLVDDSKTWRRQMIAESLRADYRIVLACVNIFGQSADRIRESKEKVARFCFSDALMRVALLVRESPAETCDVILDWPDGNRHATFTDEYRSAYTDGCCHDSPLVKYYSGPLSALGFSDSPLFARMADCPLLQFSDLVVGATRDFVRYCLEKKPADSIGVHLTKILVPKFRGYPHSILGRGISVSPRGGTLQKKLSEGMLKLRESSN